MGGQSGGQLGGWWARLLVLAVLLAGLPAPAHAAGASPDGIPYCVDPDWAPYEWISGQGRHEGIAADLLRLVAERAGLTLRLTPTADWNESLQAAREGHCMMLSFLNTTAQRRQWLTFTDPLYIDPNVVITHQDHAAVTDLAALDGQRVALPKGTSIEERLRREYPKLVIVITETEAEAFGLVSTGKADMAIRSMTVAVDTIRKKGWFNLKVAGQVPGYENLLRIGVRNEVAEELVPRLNSGIASVTPEERVAVANRHVAIEVTTGIDPDLVWNGAGVLGGILAASLFWVLKLKSLNRRLHVLSHTDGLTGLENRSSLNAYLAVVMARLTRQGGVVALILIDVDHFKQVNDSRGHQAGDRVLTELSARLKQAAGDGVTVGRWGGEEFLAICPDLSETDAKALAERMRKAVAEVPFADGHHYTFSAGVSLLSAVPQGMPDLDAALARADQALYAAKSAGRNCMNYL
ncbi:diguanylate cyclase domain-containing protein [Novispirillum itersonii]|uniref:diguanylate cyclase domain-containing protein n=1 Tax=Novispirillum itersonii TaxID=189 RepID=UPI00146A512E|nr:diguanylate cyclase [Novispirillum itersonii]